MSLTVVPLTERTWPALTELFGPNGAVAGCWCTWFLQSANQVRDNGSDANREMLHGRVRTGAPVGVLAMDDDIALGWTAVAPRSCYPRLARSPVARPEPDDLDAVWSVTCFFVHRTARGRGVGSALLAGAVDYARELGATAVEGYPVETEGNKRSSGELYHGTVGLFRDAGFEIVRRPGPRRALMRRELS